MKKSFLVTGLLTLSLLLGACAAANQSGTPSSAGQGGSGRNGASQDGSQTGQVPIGMELALGTLALKNSNNPVDAKEAAQLLFLWKGMNSLLQSQTTASEEVQGLIKQIQATMTPAQVQSIKNMHLTYQDLPRIAQQAGVQIGGGGGQFGNISPEARATFQAARQSGQGGGNQGGARIPGFGGGGFGGGGFGGGGGGNNTSSNNTQFRTVSAFQGTGLNEVVISAVIRYLQTAAK
jgi:hypothetical protein